MTPNNSRTDTVTALGQALMHKGWRLSAAESCTGGLIAAQCSHWPGASAWFAGGIVAYSAALKQTLLQVPAACIAEQGIVSQAVAEAMARGAQARCQTEVAVATTGWAGPAQDDADEPVGWVCMAWAIGPELHSLCRHFDGDRSTVRRSACDYALEHLLSLLRA